MGRCLPGARPARGNRSRRIAAPWVLAILLLAPPAALAQGAAEAYASRAIRLVVNFAPGGTVDVIGRSLAQKLAEAFAQPVVVENRPGANGNIGAELVARSRADGYTLLMTSGGALTNNPHLYRSMTVDPLRDFAPISEIARISPLLVVRPSLPVKSASEFLAYVRANPGRLSYGSAGNGSGPHISGEMLNRLANVSVVHVPYKGLGPALGDLLAGQIDFMFDGGGAISQIRSGKIALLAVGSGARLAQFPDTPALNEAAVPGFNNDSAHALLAPAGTPGEVIGRLHREVARILRTPEIAERIRATGAEVIGNAPEEFAANLRAEHQRMGRFIREAGIRSD